MWVTEIEQLFQSEDTLDQILEQVKEDFEVVDKWSNVRKENLTDNPEEITKALNELSGAYGRLRVVLGVAETEKRNRHVRFKENMRIEVENSGGKYTDTKAETAASAFVANYRRIRNIILAYTEAADKHINTLQSILKDIRTEYNTQNQ